jgi:AraC-like DNA-binding protein
MKGSAPYVRINRLGRFYCAADWSWETHGYSAWTGESKALFRWNFDLWVVLQGQGRLQAPGASYSLHAGDCFILRGDERYAARHDPADPLSVYAVHFDYLDKDGRLVVPHETRLHRRIEHMEFFSELLDRMEAAWLEEGRGRDDAHRWLRACLMEIDRQDRAAALGGHRREHTERIEELCREIRLHPEKDWRVTALAGRMHCTRHHFARLFKEVKGTSPRDFVIRTRVAAAKGLLHTSNYPIGRIADMLGYRDVFYFSRQFRKEAGMSPTAFRSRRHE